MHQSRETYTCEPVKYKTICNLSKLMENYQIEKG